MHAFDGNGIIQQYRTAVEVIEHFFPLRLDLYRRRREEMIKKSRFDELLTGSKARFIEDILCGSLSLTHAGDSGAVKGKGQGESVHYKSYEELVLDLRERGFLSEGQITARSVAGDADERDVADAGAGAGAGADAGPGGGYSYLLNMPIHSFTKDRVDRLQQGAADAKANLDTILNRTTPEDLWLQDLDALRKEIVKYYKCD
jgi:DNA topoisomerase II